MLVSLTGKFSHDFFFWKVFFQNVFFLESFFQKVFLERFSGKFFQKVFPGKFFLESFWKKNSGRFFYTIYSDFLVIFRQYKILDFFLDFFNFRFRKQISTFTFPDRCHVTFEGQPWQHWSVNFEMTMLFCRAALATPVLLTTKLLDPWV